MQILSNNPVLMAMAAGVTRERVAAAEVALVEEQYVDEEVARRVDRIIRTLRMRRSRRWDKVLGRRADGHTIRPIQTPGRCFRFTPILSSSVIAEVREAVRAEVERTGRGRNCESCYTVTHYRDESGTVLCSSCIAWEGSVEAHSEAWYSSFEEWASHEAV